MAAELWPHDRPFYRRLPWSVVVRTAGFYDDADREDPALEDPAHPPVKVVIELPDFLAESLSQTIRLLWSLREQFDDGSSPDLDLAQALHDASANRRLRP